MHHLHTVYNTIYDSPKSGLNLLIISSIFLLIVAFCIMMYRGRGRNAVLTLNTGNKGNPYLLILIPTTFVYLLFGGIDLSEISIYKRDKAFLNSNQVKVVEGDVTDFHAMPDNGHGYEYFYVAGIGFQYSKYEEAIGGYHTTALDGGIIKPNLYIRISYEPTDFRNIILKIETD